MKELLQNRLNVPGVQRGNCFPTVIACLMELNSGEEVIQIQEYYPDNDGMAMKEDPLGGSWVEVLQDWLDERGWDWYNVEGHLSDGRYYLVTGYTRRSKECAHVCIYRDGELIWDPHPDQSGLINELEFEVIERRVADK